MAELIGILTLGLLVSITLVVSRMLMPDIVVSMALLIVDILGLYLLVDDTRRAAKKSQDRGKERLVQISIISYDCKPRSLSAR